jgi:hypothetical protein
VSNEIVTYATSIEDGKVVVSIAKKVVLANTGEAVKHIVRSGKADQGFILSMLSDHENAVVPEKREKSARRSRKTKPAQRGIQPDLSMKLATWGRLRKQLRDNGEAWVAKVGTGAIMLLAPDQTVASNGAYVDDGSMLSLPQSDPRKQDAVSWLYRQGSLRRALKAEGLAEAIARIEKFGWTRFYLGNVVGRGPTVELVSVNGNSQKPAFWDSREEKRRNGIRTCHKLYAGAR